MSKSDVSSAYRKLKSKNMKRRECALRSIRGHKKKVKALSK